MKNFNVSGRKAGFTLAEVLITLGIIGVVAAMTIPTLIANTNGAKFRSQFKKSISTLNQAGLMSVAQYDVDFAGATGACGATQTSDLPTTSPMSFCGLLNGTLTGYSAQLLSGYANYTRTGSNITLASTAVAYQLADGAIVAFDGAAKTCSVPVGGDPTALASTCRGFIDVNGVTGPNKEVKCHGSSGAVDAWITTSTCEVQNNASEMTDIFPVVFHDATVEPLTNAARYVLTTTK